MDEILEYYQFPRFLLKMNLSSNAKLAYMLIYDRHRLSERVGWQDHGRVYCVYPVTELAEHLGVTRRAVFNCLKELKEIGALETKRRGPSNMCFIKVPEDGEGNFSYYVKKTSHNKGTKLPLSNYKEVTTRGKKSPPKGVPSSPSGNSNTELVYNEDTGRYEYRKKEPD